MGNNERPSAKAFAPLAVSQLCAAALILVLGANSSDVLLTRSEEVKNLLPNEQQQLLRNQERFAALPSAEQDRLHKLHSDLTSAPDGAKLRTVLERYHEWLKTLSPERRAELVELPADARVAQIVKWVAEQKEDQKRRRPRFSPEGPPLPSEDQQAVAQWFDQIVWAHREELMASMPTQRRHQLDKLDEPSRKRALLWVAMQRWKWEPPPIEPSDIEHLMQSLTPGTRERLSEIRNIGQKRKQVREWLQQAIAPRMEQMAMRRGLIAISSEDLEKFFQNDLPKDERDRLLNLPRDQMQQELRQMYIHHTGRPEPPPGGPPGFPPLGGPRGGRPGRPNDPEGPPRRPDDRERREGRPDGPPLEGRFERPDRPEGLPGPEFRHPRRQFDRGGPGNRREPPHDAPKPSEAAPEPEIKNP